LAGATCAVLRERFIPHSVEFASPRISLDSLVETLSVKRFKPDAKSVNLRGGGL